MFNSQHRPAGSSTGRSENRGRSGFTLVELLVAIGIVAILAALLLGGIQAATQAVATAKVSSDIRALETALATFQSEYGHYPPSSITLYESNSADPGWNVDTTDPTRLSRSRQIITELFPEFDFGAHDINQDGDTNDVIVLSGDECLVFFLGGMPDLSQYPTYIPKGFSKNPTNPFSTSGVNRVGPFAEFQINRFVDADNDRFAEYMDPLSGQFRPYAYFSGYDGRGYRAADGALASGAVAYFYLQALNEPYKKNSFQIVSPGRDSEYGTGGIYDPSGSRNTISEQDKDNLSSIASGTLN